MKIDTSSGGVYVGEIEDAPYGEPTEAAQVNCCGIHVDARAYTIREHGRTDYHILFVQSGELLAEIDGTVYTLRSGDFIFYPPGVRHSYQPHKGICYWIHFSGTDIEHILEQAGISGNRIFNGAQNKDKIISHFQKLIYHYEASLPMREMLLCADLIELLYEFAIAVRNTTTYSRSLPAVILYMNESYFQHITLNDYAKLAGLSSSRFAHIFKETMGISPTAYLLNLRLEKARDLLHTTTMPIIRVAEKSGFDDPHYFSRAFSKKYGVSPKEYRSTK